MLGVTKQATLEDDVLNKVKTMLPNDSCDDDSLKPYYNIRTELSVTSDWLILYGKRIVVPKKLQNEIINIAHQSHQGRDKTKQLLNKFVLYWLILYLYYTPLWSRENAIRERFMRNILEFWWLKHLSHFFLSQLI